MPTYQQMRDPVTNEVSTTTILRKDDGAVIPCDPLNADYMAYKVWEDKGNKPMPAPALVDVALSTATTTTNASAKVG